MRICGVVAEYNPFHKGHAHQLAAAKDALGGDCAAVCCMSGDFVLYVTDSPTGSSFSILP